MKYFLPAFAMLAAPALAEAPVATDQIALRALAAEADAAWNARNADRMASLYAERASFQLGASAPVEGRPAIQAYFDSSFRQRERTMRHVTSVDRLEMLTPTIALSDADVRVERLEADGGWTLVRAFRNVSVVEKIGKHWRIRSVRAYPTPSKG